jgi:hypothetical protein
MIGCAQLRGS